MTAINSFEILGRFKRKNLNQSTFLHLVGFAVFLNVIVIIFGVGYLLSWHKMIEEESDSNYLAIFPVC